MHKYFPCLVLSLVDNVWMYTSYFSSRSQRRLGLLVTLKPNHGSLHETGPFCSIILCCLDIQLGISSATISPSSIFSLVRVYKIKWWPESKTQLCGKENGDYFCKNGKRKFILHNLHLFVKSKVAPATPAKKEVKREKSSSSSTKTKAKGLSEKGT